MSKLHFDKNCYFDMNIWIRRWTLNSSESKIWYHARTCALAACFGWKTRIFQSIYAYMNSYINSYINSYMNSYRNSEEKTKDYSKARCLVRRKIHWNSSCKSKKRKSSCCSTRYCKKQCCRSGGRTRCHGTSRRWGKWIFFFSTSRNVLPIFGTYCPVRGLITMTAVQFSHFQIQGLIDARRAVTVSMHAVKFLYTTLLYRSAPVFHSRSSWYNSRHVVRASEGPCTRSSFFIPPPFTLALR